MPIETIGGLRMQFEDSGGAGAPVVLLHGFPLSRAMWEAQLEGLGNRWRVVAPDLPGFGGSSPPENPASWRMNDYADAVQGLMSRLGIEKATIVGFSMGGYVAFSLLRRHPSLVGALVLVDTRAEADSEETRSAREEQQEEVRREGVQGLARKLLPKLLAPSNLDDPRLVDRVLSMMSHPPAGYLAALEAMKRRPDSTLDLGGFQVPSLVIVGAKDVLTPPPLARVMSSAIRGARLAVLPEAGHLSNVEEADAFNDALASFLEELEPPLGFSHAR